LENPIKLFLVAIILVASIFAPVELSMWPRRQLAEALYSSGYENYSKYVYGSLAFNKDVVGTANFYMLKFRDVYPTRAETLYQRQQLLDPLSEALISLQEISHIADYNRLMLLGGAPISKDTADFINRKLKLLQEAKDPETEKIFAGSTRDFDQIAFLTRLADLGHVYAAYDLGALSRFDPNDPSLNTTKLRALLKAAEGGFSDGMVEYAKLISSDKPKEAKQWFEKAAQLGNVWASMQLGRCYENDGDFCKKQDIELAVSYYKKAVLGNLPIVFPYWQMENGIIRMTFTSQNQHSESSCNCNTWGLRQLLRLAQELKTKTISQEEIVEYKKLLNIDSPNEFKL
jgi:Sel1 repeat